MRPKPADEVEPLVYTAFLLKENFIEVGELNFGYCRYLDIPLLIDVLPFLKHLTHLRLNSCDQVSEHNLIHISDAAPKLEWLDASHT